MSLNKQKKLEYIAQILDHVKDGSIELDHNDSILLEVALDFIAEIGAGGSDGGGT